MKNSKIMNNAKKQTSPRQMTEEERKEQMTRAFMQRRELFSINILCSLLQNNPGVHPEDVVIKSVDLADNLIKKLYPMEEESK